MGQDACSSKPGSSDRWDKQRLSASAALALGLCAQWWLLPACSDLETATTDAESPSIGGKVCAGQVCAGAASMPPANTDPMVALGGRHAPQPLPQPATAGRSAPPPPPPTCHAAGESCLTGACCAGTTCVDQDNGKRCMLLCTRESECSTGCCVELEEGTASVCAPATYCPTSSDTSQPESGENGVACSADSDCESGHCGRSVGGDLLCYGDGTANETCSEHADCRGGPCLPKTLGEDGMVCTPGALPCIERMIPTECAKFHFIYCAFLSSCDEVSEGLEAAKNDHNACVETLCSSADPGDDEETCRALNDALLAGEVDCPID